MILIIEAKFRDWQHEECNAGMINNIVEHFKGEDIIFAAEKKHIEAITDIYLPKHVKTMCIDFATDIHEDNYRTALMYFFLIINIFRRVNIKKEDKVVFLSCNKGIILISALLSCVYRSVKIYLICHAFFEDLLKPDYQPERIYSVWNVMNISGLFPRLNYIVFSPFVKNELRGKISKRTIKKIHFLHHPIECGNQIYRKQVDTDCIIIGVYGAGVNGNAYKVINYVNTHSESKNYLFRIMQSSGFLKTTSFSKYPRENTSIVKYKGGMDRRTRIEEMKKIDWILIPYGSDSYRAGMSGILADAIKYEIPILGLNSPIIKWYGKSGIGIVGDSVEDLGNKIIQMLSQPQDSYKAYYNAIHRTKSIIKEKNVIYMREIFDS